MIQTILTYLKNREAQMFSLLRELVFIQRGTHNKKENSLPLFESTKLVLSNGARGSSCHSPRTSRLARNRGYPRSSSIPGIPAGR
jgi:hypothetical protein